MSISKQIDKLRGFVNIAGTYYRNTEQLNLYYDKVSLYPIENYFLQWLYYLDPFDPLIAFH